ncbi:MAG TPA: hypothetical protein VKX28_30830 [Xanthobacteraceae bacterium]|nr:hypothetical protein [Xanthobacteraceae bacterium]
MIDRRHTLRLALAALPAVALLGSRPARADQPFERFYPFLVDLQGWTAKKPDGMAMQMGGMSMLTASREYERADARIHVGILTGPPAQGGLAMIQAGMKIDTADSHMSTDMVDGLKLARTYTTKDRSGAIMVGLADNALFSFSFNKLAEDEAFTLARKFDWKGIQAALPK